MRRGKAIRKLDASFHLPRTQSIIARLDNSLFSVVEMSELLAEQTGIRYGTSTPPIFIEPSDSSVPFLRATDIKDGEILTDNLLHISALQPERMLKCIVEAGEMILVRSGVNTGDCAIVPEELSGSFAAYDLILRFNSEVEPLYVASFLDTTLGRVQLNILKARSAQPHLNADEVKSLRIVKPLLPVQRELVAEMQAARERRAQRLRDADAELAGMDAFLLDALGLTPPPADERTVYAVRAKSVKKYRADPHFFHPDFVHLAETIRSTTHDTLGNLAAFSNEQWNPVLAKEETFRYIEISNVRLDTGEAQWAETPVAEAPSRARMLVREGDIIVSTTRPHHGAIAMIDAELDGCIASTGFAVIRGIAHHRIDSVYLWCVLRCRLCLRQMLQRSSGGNYPAITEGELRNVLVPVPDADIQKRVVQEVERRQERARTLREEAAREWEAAKAAFERRLLGGNA